MNILKPEDLAVKVRWSIEDYSILKPRCVKTQGKREFETIRLFAGCCVVPLATTHGAHGLVIASRLTPIQTMNIYKQLLCFRPCLKPN
jgi:hypothetical protein